MNDRKITNETKGPSCFCGAFPHPPPSAHNCDPTPAKRAELCRCGHSSGNHRWYAVGGKRDCHDYGTAGGDKCGCKAFVAQDSTIATNDDRRCKVQVAASLFGTDEKNSISWTLAKIVHKGYELECGVGTQSLERLAERGGFSLTELVCFAYSAGAGKATGLIWNQK